MKVSRKHVDGFTLIELLAMIAVVALLAVMLIPAVAGTRPNAQAFQCQNNEKQLTVAWQMYADDNKDLLAPNDFPYTTAYFTYANKGWMQNWVVGTMESPFDSRDWQELVPTTANFHTNSCLAGYITNAVTFRCPADIYIDPFSHTQHVRSYSMNSAIGTLWFDSSTFAGGAGAPKIGSPVGPGWLNGDSYDSSGSQRWLTYSKITSLAKPGPANTFVFMDENPYTINAGAMYASANAVPGATYLIDYPAGNHNGSGCISFADGHVVIHKWLDSQTVSPQGYVGPIYGTTAGTKVTPDDPDCFYLAQITSAAR